MNTRPPLDGSVLVTGASSGIGKSLARLFAARASALVLVARRKDRLEELAAELTKNHPSLKVVVEACDVANQADTDAMIARVREQIGPIDNLVNNAGMGDVGVFDRADWAKTEKMITLNVTSLAFLTHRLLPSMVARGKGGILNISSGFGLTFGPGLTAYIATKHFVSAFTESLRLDLSGTGVAVTQVCPGPVTTEFLENAGNPTEMDPPGIVTIDADTCARASFRGFAKGRALIVPGFVMKLMMLSAAMTPRWMFRLFYAPIARALRKKQLGTALAIAK